jgi:hypothetical protein
MNVCVMVSQQRIQDDLPYDIFDGIVSASTSASPECVLFDPAFDLYRMFMHSRAECMRGM